MCDKGPSQAQRTFQRAFQPSRSGWSGRASGRCQRGYSGQIAVDGEAEPVTVKLRMWVSNTKPRRDKPAQYRLDALRELGMEWA